MNLQRLIRYFAEEGQPRPGPSPRLAVGDSGLQGHYGALRLSSRYQPLLNRQQEVVAYEALLRVQAPDGGYLPPDRLFARLDETQEVMVLDRLCRVMHAVNYVRQPHHGRLLFLNVNGRHLQGVSHGHHGATFEALLDHCGLSPTQVVLEILESSVDDLPRLQAAIQAYKAKGFRIAIDDFGCRHSNFDRLWALEPDIVKLDRELTLQAQHNRRAAKVLPALVRLIQELGALVVCEGIETEAQHQLATAAGSDLLQGYYYGRPAVQLLASHACSV